MANINSSSENPKVDLQYRRKKNAEDMKKQVVSFVLMIFLTLIAFAAVGFEELSFGHFVVPFIVVLAAIQVVFQLYYFMHMSHKGHEQPTLFLFSGVLVALLTVAAMMTLVWW
ncbi:cytochrome c oxidase subunit IVB [Bacillus sp. HMF5848]|uniref:cytochrome c oxidase subunit IVB n=1 Tax=Bacillus sp. HMF5848 TaxID=2495421 RepID=UPI000F76AB7C|nr:cytochrome c oxidase subunit IVB [Bacillus sp. HMF5848]RSK26902.1 cytochrome c oxidase subunit IVB [Bacillus sp. HMF5848]